MFLVTYWNQIFIKKIWNFFFEKNKNDFWWLKSPKNHIILWIVRFYKKKIIFWMKSWQLKKQALISQYETPGEHSSKCGDQIKNYFIILESLLSSPIESQWQKGDKRVTKAEKAYTVILMHWAFECSWVLSPPPLPSRHCMLLCGGQSGWMDGW
jgi:hypothetical protein